LQSEISTIGLYDIVLTNF